MMVKVLFFSVVQVEKYKAANQQAIETLEKVCLESLFIACVLMPILYCIRVNCASIE